MKKYVVASLIIAGVILFGAIGAAGNDQSSTFNTVQTGNTPSVSGDIPEKIMPTCDGMTITTGCVLDGISYKTYIYHPSVAEKSHTATETTYREEVVGYCTLCRDGTYSPSCATGRGACSHHGGVAQWNAPMVRKVPVSSTKTIIDAPAQKAYYEKIIE